MRSQIVSKQCMIILKFCNSVNLFGTNVCKKTVLTQRAVLEKNDYDGMNVNMNTVFNLTVLSVRFLFLSKVQSFLSFDNRCALCFGKTRHIASR